MEVSIFRILSSLQTGMIMQRWCLNHTVQKDSRGVLGTSFREGEVVCTRSLQHQVLSTWSYDQKIKAEIRQATSNQGNSYSSGDDVLIDNFEMMHTSPDLFSQSLSPVQK